MWILTDRQGQTKPEYEIVDGIGRRQYCSQSVIVAKDGSLIWYNDAGRIYCYENAANMEPGIFRDTKNHWAKDQIALLAGEDILNGTGDGYFSPETKVTRSQFVQMLSKFSGEDCSAYTTDEFADVGSGDWYAPAVAWAVEHGITTGSGNGLFSPNAPITRQDMAVMLQRYVEKVAKEELPQENAILEFTDASSIAVYAKDAVAAMQTAGIINGISDGGSYRFAPEAQATRAQAASMIAGLYHVLYGQD